MERVGILPDLWVAAIEMDDNENEVILHKEARVPRTVVLCYYYSKNWVPSGNTNTALILTYAVMVLYNIKLM